MDDMIAGTLISRGPSSFVVAVERGTFQGEAIEPGEWKRVTPADAQIIETWLARDEPQVGDRVALRYRGIRGGKDGRRVTSHLFDCGTYREPVAEPAPAEPSW